MFSNEIWRPLAAINRKSTNMRDRSVKIPWQKTLKSDHRIAGLSDKLDGILRLTICRRIRSRHAACFQLFPRALTVLHVDTRLAALIVHAMPVGFLLAFLLSGWNLAVHAQSIADVPVTSEPTALEVTQKIADAGRRLMESLDEAQRKKLLFQFDDQQQRERWSNLPTGMFDRSGLRWGDLSESQKSAVHQLLKAIFSQRGFQQVVDNMHADEVLRRSSGRRRNVYGSDEYYLSILGDPSTGRPWIFQFGGHHLAINATIVGDQMTLSPLLTGGNPVDFDWKGAPVRLLGEEEDAAYALMASLSPEQRRRSVIGNRFVDLEFGPGTQRTRFREEGIRVSTLDEQQQAMVRELIEQRIGLINSVHAQNAMDRMNEHDSDTWFSWYGPTDPGMPATFRIQNPSFVIEYSPQGNPQKATQHTHAMYRDLGNDYGKAFLDASKNNVEK